LPSTREENMNLSHSVIVLGLFGALACSSPDQHRSEDGGLSSPDAHRDGQLPPFHDSGAEASVGVSYPCLALSRPSGGGDGGSVGTSAPPPECMVGKTYCYNFWFSAPAVSSVRSCRGYDDLTDSTRGSLGAVCAETPTCECLCAHAYYCQEECRCSENNGQVTVSCEQI
jgi:hypothetical protein